MAGENQFWRLRSRIRVARFGQPLATVDRGYDRQRDLPGLLPLYFEELEISSQEAHQCLVRRLKSALRVERTRGKQGHWSYDVGRHTALLKAYKIEKILLKSRKAKYHSGY